MNLRCFMALRKIAAQCPTCRGKGEVNTPGATANTQPIQPQQTNTNMQPAAPKPVTTPKAAEKPQPTATPQSDAMAMNRRALAEASSSQTMDRISQGGAVYDDPRYLNAGGRSFRDRMNDKQRSQYEDMLTRAGTEGSDLWSTHMDGWSDADRKIFDSLPAPARAKIRQAHTKGGAIFNFDSPTSPNWGKRDIPTQYRTLNEKQLVEKQNMFAAQYRNQERPDAFRNMQATEALARSKDDNAWANYKYKNPRAWDYSLVKEVNPALNNPDLWKNNRVPKAIADPYYRFSEDPEQHKAM